MSTESKPDTGTLAGFLLARIAEDEEAARKAYVPYEDKVWDAQGNWRDGTNHLKRWLPSRVLTECRAKRKVVQRCADVGYLMPSSRLALGILVELALQYDEHPDYREVWRP